MGDCVKNLHIVSGVTAAKGISIKLFVFFDLQLEYSLYADTHTHVCFRSVKEIPFFYAQVS